jgi:PAS domain S-box-containing protein
MILKPRYEIATADSGEAALQKIASFRPDVVFMDIKMPTMDGVEALRRIKDQDPAIEVVMITAYASLETVKNALTHGAFEYLVKPFNREELEETVRRAVDRRLADMKNKGQVARLARDMSAFAAKARTLEETARREAALQALRVTQLSILREISGAILGELDLDEMTRTITQQLQAGFGYDAVAILPGAGASLPKAGPSCFVMPIRAGAHLLAHLVVDNRASGRRVDPHERETLEMLSEFLAIAIQNSNLYGQIAETKRSLEQIIRSAGEGIISLDARDRIVGWNPAAEQIFGLPSSDALGQPITRILPEESYRSERAALEVDQIPRAFQARIARPDGRAVEVGVTLSAIRGRGGEPEGILAIIRDITVQREMESQLLQSQKLAALGQMAGGIAHDFNNLLQSIMGYVQLIRRHLNDPERILRELQIIETSATDGAETVRRIQEFARLRPDEEFVPVEMNSVIREAVAITRPRWEERIAERGVQLDLRLELNAIPVISGRPAELREVMTNLILNAIDAMPQGGCLTMTTRAYLDSRSPNAVEVTVADTGIGIPEEVRSRIFDPFFTTKGEAGTGLGLSISYSIIRRHGGEIRVESEVGRGSTFAITLPAGSPEDAPHAPAEDSRRRRGRILVVDDEPHVLTILTAMLKELGHTVTSAANAASALETFPQGRYDLVLADIGMSGINGWEMAARLRALDPTVPVAFITGWGLNEKDRERCRALGIAYCLFKPVKPADLHRVVQDALSR